MGQTVMLEELKGEIPSVLIIIPGLCDSQLPFKAFHFTKEDQFPENEQKI